jgi:hypothetical protein
MWAELIARAGYPVRHILAADNDINSPTLGTNYDKIAS